MNRLKVPAFPEASYSRDLAAWSSDQARRLRAARPAGIDWENLAEEVESLGRNDRRALGSALKVILEHLLKWRYQPEKRSPSWIDSIEEHRDRIQRILDDSPSLAPAPIEMLAREYDRARRKMLRDTSLAAAAIPLQSPFSAAEAIDPEFWPEAGA